MDLVKRYKFKKVNGLPIEGQSEIEINQILITTLSQIYLNCLFKNDTNNQALDLINHVIIPALISVEK